MCHGRWLRSHTSSDTASGGVASAPMGGDRGPRPRPPAYGARAACRVGLRVARADTTPEAVCASPFLRTVETADGICLKLEATVERESGLGEYRIPEWFDREARDASRERAPRAGRGRPCRARLPRQTGVRRPATRRARGSPQQPGSSSRERSARYSSSATAALSPEASRTDRPGRRGRRAAARSHAAGGRGRRFVGTRLHRRYIVSERVTVRVHVSDTRIETGPDGWASSDYVSRRFRLPSGR